MSQHILSTPHAAMALPTRDRRVVAQAVQGVLNRFLLLPLGVAIALVWANLEPEPYFQFAHRWAFYVNEIGMVFFLALVTQEVFEAVMRGGALHTWRHWSLALVAALGGLAGAALTFVAYVSLAHETVLTMGWSVAAAVDVAAGYYVLKVIYPHRSGALPFLLLTALITDACAIALVGLQAEEVQLHAGGGALMVAAVALAFMLRRHKVQRLWPYLLLCGALSWSGLAWMGFHPALALVPIVPFMPHRPRSIDVFADRPAQSDRILVAEHRWNVVAQVALFFFGLVNAGVILRHYDTGTWAVMVAALAGRPIGVLAAMAVAVAAGLHLPRRLRWSDMTVIALAMSSGFTFALFMVAAALPLGAVAQEIKLGALATAVGAVIALAAAWALGVGRFELRRT
jgi:NhaA family Na+:H+ antiporter